MRNVVGGSTSERDKVSEKNSKTEKRAKRASYTAEGAPDDADKSSLKGGQDSVSPAQKPRPKKKRNYWALKITVVSLVLSAFISFLTELTSSAENIIVTVILLLFLIMASILFDGIGVAVTSCDITPIVSMASKKEYGAKTAMWLVKNNEKVSNVCNDVIGDIFGIISGACGAAIAIKIVTLTDDKYQQWIAIAVSAVVSALTIGGKAFLKNIAITNSKEFVMFVARIIGIFHPEERRRKKKEAEKKKKYSAAANEDGNSDNRQKTSSQPSKNDRDKAEKSIKPLSVKASSAVGTSEYPVTDVTVCEAVSPQTEEVPAACETPEVAHVGVGADSAVNSESGFSSENGDEA